MPQRCSRRLEQADHVAVRVGHCWVAQPAVVNGTAGLVVTRGGRTFAVLGFVVSRGRIARIDILADLARLRRPVSADQPP